MTLISIGNSLFLQLIIDIYIPNLRITQLLVVSTSLFLSYILYALFNYFSGYLSLVLSQKLSIDLLLKYIRHLFDVPIALFNTRRAGELTSRLEDANNIIHTLASTTISAFLNIGTVILIGITLFVLDFKLFLITATLIPLYFLIVYKFMKRFDKLNTKRMESGAKLVSTLIEDIHGMETIKAFNVADSQYHKIDHKFVDQLQKNFMYEKLNVLQSSLKTIVRLSISLLVLSIGALLVIHGRLSLGKLVAFNSLLTYFILPLEEIVNLQSNIQTAKIANMRLNQILNIPKEETLHTITSKELLEFKPSQIIMENIQFEYKYGQPVLNHLNLTIPLGTSTAIIGLSGSGKSTLAKLLIGFYKPTRGEIRLQSKTKSINLKNYQQQIVYLPQKPYIFSGTIRDNITLGRFKCIEDAQVEHVAKLAQIHEDIKKSPDGYNTKLSGNDILSGGQQQRIAIARALLSDATILIFDEATSNLDVKTEKSVIDNILQVQNKTIIFIAHRLYIAKKVDQILVMNKGKIIENGTHTQLLKQKGQYYKLLEA
ncbi:peptide cleavage/export ABC transporter [Lactiplantibacillus plantarum]|uniref:peptide cleavage/export ABC transporter n=1 Tax=Lactiplantibacillus plantarum TaxID=1590 RepID=UPI003F539313